MTVKLYITSLAILILAVGIILLTTTTKRVDDSDKPRHPKDRKQDRKK